MAVLGFFFFFLQKDFTRTKKALKNTKSTKGTKITKSTKIQPSKSTKRK